MKPYKYKVAIRAQNKYASQPIIRNSTLLYIVNDSPIENVQ